MSGANTPAMGSVSNLSILKGPTRELQSNLLHRLFEIIANGPASEKTALIFQDSSVNFVFLLEGDKTKHYTYSTLDCLSNQMARVLKDIIVSNDLPRNSDGDYIIAIALPASDRLIIALLAILKTGAAYLPIDPTFPGPRVQHIIQEAEPVVVIYEDDSEYFLTTNKISINELILSAEQISSAPLKQDECLQSLRDDLAIVLYTSGSTGVPKGVRLPHKVILNRLQWQFKIFPYSSTETTGVFKTALTFVDSVSEIWGPLINGLAILVVPKTVTADPEKLVGVLDHYKIERIVLVPSLLQSLLLYLEFRKDKSALASLKTWICSGETLSVSLAAHFLNYFPENEYKLCNFYGSTEIMGDVTYHIISNKKQVLNQEKVPIGMPIDNTILYLLDVDEQPVKVGKTGELFVAGLNLAAGYVAGRDPDRFITNPFSLDSQYARLFKTGDFAKVDKETLVFEGRTDSQVKIRGHRVDLAEIERALGDIPGVDKVVVLCYRSGELNQQLLAFVTTFSDGELAVYEGEIEQKLRYKLSAYMLPRVIRLEAIPLLVNGKVDRQTLLKEYENTDNNNGESTFQPDIDYADVQNHEMSAAKVLFQTVASVLHRSVRSVISLNANFYEIGGNSLNSIYTITSLNERGYYISISDFITALDFKQVLDRMKPSNPNENNFTNTPTDPILFTSELLKDEHKKDVICMITSSFYQKADLEQWLMPDVSEADYTELLDAIWEPLVEKRLSFICRNKSNQVVGVALNFDARDEPEVEIHSKLVIVFEYLESIEGPVRDNILPPGKNVALHSFMMGTHETLTPKDNVAIMKFMEDEVLILANKRNFVGIFTTNTSPLTQQLESDVYGYKTLYDSQVNTFVFSDNTRPFEMAPDSQHSLVQWKLI